MINKFNAVMRRVMLSTAGIMTALFFGASSVHAAGFTVSAPTPSTTFEFADTVISSNFTMETGTFLDYCELFVDGVDTDQMTLTAGTASAGTVSVHHVFDLVTNYTVRVDCYNDIGGMVSNTTVVTVFGDFVNPSVSNLAPATAVAGSPTVVSVDYNDTEFGSGIDYCIVSVDGVGESSNMTLSAGVGSTLGTASQSVTFTAGTHSLGVSCYDRSGNNGYTLGSIDVSSPPDTIAPVVGAIANISPIENTPITISAPYSDNVGVTACTLYVSGVDWGTMSLTGSLSGTASKAFAFNPAGVHSVYVNCQDAAGNHTNGAARNITVAPLSGGDTTAPVVGTPNPGTALAGSPVSISASFSDDVGVASCSLYIDSVNAGIMDRTGTVSGTAIRSYTFASAGTYTMRVQCSDAAGNFSYRERAMVVSPPGSYGPYYDKLVKLACPTSGVIDVNHPCKAVYYVAADGKRHAFPNEKVFFTWYTNFDGVIDLNSTALASIPLGKNVTYKPGTKMVKFTTLNNVYAVTRYGTLRWVTTESVATSLYGTNWNTKIDDISDAFYLDYTMGSSIDTASAYSPSGEMSAVSSIDENL